ncbi:MAG: hypothetical protein KAR06_11120 [Deltaproteobacteria bacterium]|nr:hypothetical protein [Deltaproteobacteria bacterium]
MKEKIETSTIFTDVNKNLTILAEECAEVIQVIMKIKRFGLMNVHPRVGQSNQRVRR